MTKRFSAWLITLLIALCWMIPLQAQDEESETAAVVVHITPNPRSGARAGSSHP